MSGISDNRSLTHLSASIEHWIVPYTSVTWMYITDSCCYLGICLNDKKKDYAYRQCDIFVFIYFDGVNYGTSYHYVTSFLKCTIGRPLFLIAFQQFLLLPLFFFMVLCKNLVRYLIVIAVQICTIFCTIYNTPHMIV